MAPRNPDPVMVTTVPTGPDVGLIEEITGIGALDEAADAWPPIIIKNAAVAAATRDTRSCSCILSVTSSAPLSKDGCGEWCGKQAINDRLR
jgi:hypothetical protein